MPSNLYNESVIFFTGWGIEEFLCLLVSCVARQRQDEGIAVVVVLGDQYEEECWEKGQGLEWYTRMH